MIMTRNQLRLVHISRIVLICAGAACILLGVSRGEAAVVLRKAVRICLECIGVAG